MDQDIRDLERRALETRARTDRVRFRRALERSGEAKGSRRGLRGGDLVLVVSCIDEPGLGRTWTAVVAGEAPGSSRFRLWAAVVSGKTGTPSGLLDLDWDGWPKDVSPCPECRVELISPGTGETLKAARARLKAEHAAREASRG